MEMVILIKGQVMMMSLLIDQQNADGSMLMHDDEPERYHQVIILVQERELMLCPNANIAFGGPSDVQVKEKI